MKNLAFLTLKQVAKTLQVNKMTVYREIKRGKLKAYKIEKEFRVKNEDFEAYLANAYQAAQTSMQSHRSCISPQNNKTARTGKMTKQKAVKTVSSKTKSSKTAIKTPKRSK